MYTAVSQHCRVYNENSFSRARFQLDRIFGFYTAALHLEQIESTGIRSETLHVRPPRQNISFVCTLTGKLNKTHYQSPLSPRVNTGRVAVQKPENSRSNLPFETTITLPCYETSFSISGSEIIQQMSI